MKTLKTLFNLFLLQLIVQHGLSQNRDTTKTETISLHAQLTVIYQYKPSFSAKYSGPNSLKTEEETQNTITSTLYGGARLWKNATAYLNPEISGGSGLSTALGVAASTNGESFRVGSPAPQIYLARLFLQQMFPLSKKMKYQESNFNQLGGYIPDKYIAFSLGKIALSDYFDNNS